MSDDYEIKSTGAGAHNERHSGEQLSRQITLQISPEQYERLFFQPTPARGDLAKRLGNPTLLGLCGFLIPFQTSMFCILEWGGANANSLASVSGSFYFLGGIAMVIAGLAEFILGNTFPFVVFIIYGAHWCQTGYSVSPIADLAAVYNVAASDGAAAVSGALSPAYNGGNAFYNVTMCGISFIFLIGSLRTNVPFVIVFLALVILFALFAAAYFHIGAYGVDGLEHATYLFKVAGGFGFVAALMGWYLAVITVCAATGVPCPLPIFDLSAKVFSHSKAAEDEAAGAGGGAVARHNANS